MRSKQKILAGYIPRKGGRGFFKDPINILLALMIGAILVFGMLGCGAPGYISAEALEGPAKRLIKRHKAYTQQDEGLSPQNKEANLLDGELIEEAIDSALERAKEDNEDQTGLWLEGPSVGVMCAVYHSDGICTGYPYGE